MGEPLGAKVDGSMVDLVIDELAEPIVEVEEHMLALVMDMDEYLAVLFGDEDFSNDDFEGPEDDEEVWEVNEEWLMAPVTPPSMPLVKKVITMSDVEVADSIAIGEIGPRVSTMEDQMHVMAS
ncbi:hypothetical protein Tco_0396794 [Tanacetum coccineum]